MGIYVTSDLHFNHTNILKMGRPFATIEEHNNYIIDQFNSVVGKDDLVYILGDLGFTPLKNLEPLVRRLNGRKILVLGNHDKGKIGEYRNMGFIEVYDHPVYFSWATILSHSPLKEAFDNPYVFNVHGHLHNSTLKLNHFINVNCELNDYKPLDLKKIDEKNRVKAKSRRENFGDEWYYQYYDWLPGKGPGDAKK